MTEDYEMDVTVTWGSAETQGYGKIHNGRYDGCALQQDGYSMLVLYGGNWVRLTSVDPEVPPEARVVTEPASIRQVADIDSAYQSAGANRASQHAPKLKTTDSAYYLHNLERLQSKTVEILNL